VEYTIALGYVPNGMSLGFSKSVRAIELLASQPISQEDLTQLIIETFKEQLKPKGMMLK